MTTPPINSDSQYWTILGGLREDHRVGYKETSDGQIEFVDLKKDTQTAGVKTELSDVAQKIEEFIKANPNLGNEKIDTLNEALEKRANKLSSRMEGIRGWFVSDKDKAIIKQRTEQLKGLKNRISSQARKISTAVPPSVQQATGGGEIVQEETSMPEKKIYPQREETSRSQAASQPKEPSPGYQRIRRERSDIEKERAAELAAQREIAETKQKPEEESQSSFPIKSPGFKRTRKKDKPEDKQ